MCSASNVDIKLFPAFVRQWEEKTYTCGVWSCTRICVDFYGEVRNCETSFAERLDRLAHTSSVCESLASLDPPSRVAVLFSVLASLRRMLACLVMIGVCHLLADDSL